MQVGVFVDISNQFKCVIEQFDGGRLNYEQYLTAAVGSNQLYRAYAYGVQMSGEAHKFISALKCYGYDVRYKKARRVKGRLNIEDTSWAVGIAMDVVRILEKLDVVVLGSNDPELVDLIQFCQERGKRVVVFACKVPDDLRAAADSVVDITATLVNPV